MSDAIVEARHRLAAHMTRLVLGQSADYAELMVWMAAGFGGTLALLIAESSVTHAFLGTTSYVQLFALAIDGLVFGVLGKYTATRAMTAASMLSPHEVEASRNLLADLVLTAEDRLEAARGAIDEVVPSYFRWNARRGMRAGLSDPLALHKMAASWASQAIICCWCQIAIATLGVGLVLYRALSLAW